MHSHTIILAALSAGALSVSLTAKDFTNSANQPNVKCTGANNGESALGIETFLVLSNADSEHEGMDVGIDYVTCPAKQPDCNCHLYGTYLWNPEALERGMLTPLFSTRASQWQLRLDRLFRRLCFCSIRH